MASASQTKPQLSSPLGSLVGMICKWDPITEKSSDPLSIYSRQEIYVGRDAAKCQYVINDPFVSNKHLRIHTVIFDQDNPGEVAPLVYAEDLSTNGSLWNQHWMGNGQRGLLLSDGDTIQLSGRVTLRYASVGYPQTNSFTRSQELEMAMFGHEYTVTQRRLGSGAYGLVHMAYNKSTGQQFACKIVDLVTVKKRVAMEVEAQNKQGYGMNTSAKLRDIYANLKWKEKLKQFYCEASILENLQHPNIIGLEKVIQSDNTIYIIQDLLKGGDLFSYIQHKGGRLPDIEAAVIVRQIVIALDYLHDQNIVHRDLKPDNILMTSRADGCRVVLTDFGCATRVDRISNRMSTMIGTFEFSAPEVVMQNDKGYTKAADLWSLGCLTAVVLTGESVFDNVRKGCGMNFHRTRAIEKLEGTMNRRQVGQRAQDFVFQLLQHDASERMDVKQALQHEWFTNPAHKSDFDALYERSIRDWKPCRATKPRIVGLASYIKTCPSQSSQNSSALDAESNDPSQASYIKSEPRSQCVGFAFLSTAETDDQQSSCLTHISSEALSDVDLLPHKKIKVTDNHLRVASKNTDTYSVTSSASRRDPLRNITNSLTAPKSSDSQGIQAFLFDARHGARYHSISRMREKCSHKDAGEPDAEVFEEIRNHMTGKRQQLPYGALI